jgi:hypothetical protein
MKNIFISLKFSCILSKINVFLSRKTILTQVKNNLLILYGLQCTYDKQWGTKLFCKFVGFYRDIKRKQKYNKKHFKSLDLYEILIDNVLCIFISTLFKWRYKMLLKIIVLLLNTYEMQTVKMFFKFASIANLQLKGNNSNCTSVV